MTVTWFFVGLLTGGMLGMLLVALLASASHADDVAELKHRVDYCEKWHVWTSGVWTTSTSPTSYTSDSET